MFRSTSSLLLRRLVVTQNQNISTTTGVVWQAAFLRRGPHLTNSSSTSTNASRSPPQPSPATAPKVDQKFPTNVEQQIKDDVEKEEEGEEDIDEDEETDEFDEDHDDDDDDDDDLPGTTVTMPATVQTQTSLRKQQQPHSHQTGSTTYKQIILLETDFRERFIKGGGNGGQKINKTNSNVELKHYETGIVIQCQATRSLPQNRKLARKILVGRLDEYYNGELSKRAKKADKIREKKLRAARKSRKKYGVVNNDNKEGNQSVFEFTDIGLQDGGSEGEVFKTRVQSTATLNPVESKTSLPPPPLPPGIDALSLEEILAQSNKKPSRRKAAKQP